MRALVIEDEPMLNEALKEHLEKEEFRVDTVSTFREGAEQVFIEEYDLVLLDIGLPDGDGFDLLKRMRQKGCDTPVIILTARGELEDRVKGLNLGSDDYLPKPFSMLELTARVHAVLRRRFKLHQNRIESAGLVIELDSPQVSYQDRLLNLTRTEYNLLRYLALNKNKTVTRISLAEHIWGNEVDNRFSLDFITSHIKNLRKKITDSGADDPINTVYGLGYQFKGP